MHGVPEGQNIVPREWLLSNIHPEDLKNLTEQAQVFFKDPNPESAFKVNYRFRWPNGDIHYIELYATRNDPTAEEGQLTIYGVARDATEDIFKQQTIEEQRNRLLMASRMAILGEISGGIAHEINNPLTVIQARAFQLQQMTESGTLDLAKIKAAAESISRTGDKIAKIIKSLRAFSHREDEEPLHTINVHELIEETLDLCKVRFYNHGIDLRLGEIPADLEFEGRLTQFEEALLNLFNNAHDAIASLPEKWILIEALDKENELEIHVTDSGQGIPNNIAEQMMRPFFTTKEIGKGLGLGLCIASEIIHEHHGTLTYDRGYINTRFVVRLPKKQQR